MTSAQYNGHYPVTYVDHINAATGRTLVAEPGGTYDVRVAPGRNPGLSHVPGDGRWSVPAAPEEQVPEDSLEDRHDELADEDPPAAPEPAPAEPADGSETEPTPDAPEGAPLPQKARDRPCR